MLGESVLTWPRMDESRAVVPDLYKLEILHSNMKSRSKHLLKAQINHNRQLSSSKNNSTITSNGVTLESRPLCVGVLLDRLSLLLPDLRAQSDPLVLLGKHVGIAVACLESFGSEKRTKEGMVCVRVIQCRFDKVG